MKSSQSTERGQTDFLTLVYPLVNYLQRWTRLMEPLLSAGKHMKIPQVQNKAGKYHRHHAAIVQYQMNEVASFKRWTVQEQHTTLLASIAPC